MQSKPTTKNSSPNAAPVKKCIKTIVPNSLQYFLRGFYSNFKTRRIRKIFELAPKKPAWLDRSILAELQEKYSYPAEYGYDPQALEERGEQRSKDILKISAKDSSRFKTFLELGCWDGMVSCCLQRKRKITTAIDNRAEGFDKRAKKEGVQLFQMSADQLRFENNSFDFVFSYDAFEHFPNPESALNEAIRVTRIGGYIYLYFGPLYMSPLGLHAYRSITVPYCQFLFNNECLNEFVLAKSLIPIDFDSLNGLRLEDYRKLWSKYSDRLKKILYKENHDLNHLNLIEKYPSCFKSKTLNFNNLIVSNIEVLFQKTR